VLLYLASSPQIKIWSAGCSTGEEVYSMNMLLRDTNLKGQSVIYGTDINSEAISVARRGIYSLRQIKSYVSNYRASGLSGSITDHFTMMYDAATIHSELKQNISLSVHNLVSDPVFNEFQLITCRNVFIYFETALQEKVLELFYKSLSPLGFLCLGPKETIRSKTIEEKFKIFDDKQNIYQKMK